MEVSRFPNLGLSRFGVLGFSRFGVQGFWRPLDSWRNGLLEFRSSRSPDLEFLGYGDLEFWGSGDLEFWGSGDLEFWKNGVPEPKELEVSRFGVLWFWRP